MDGQEGNRERILQELRRLHAEGADLSWTAMRRDMPKLVSSAEHCFGSYGAALREAGIKGALRVVHEHRSREKIVERLRELSAAGQDLSCSGMIEAQRKLFRAACAHYGTYPAALEAAGISPGAVSRRVKVRIGEQVWTRPRIVQTLRDLFRQRADLRFSRVAKQSPGFMGAVHRRFGSYKRAVLSAGLPYPPLNTAQWTEKRLLQELRDRDGRGDDLRYRPVLLAEPHFVAAARRYCGSWQAAVGKAGIDYNAMCRRNGRRDAAAGRPPLRRKQVFWTDQRVIRELIRLRDWGQQMNPKKVEHTDAPLVQACIRRFGTYRKALAAAGIELAKPPAKRWQPQEILDGIRELYREGRRLSAYQARGRDVRLFCAACKRFGSWADALREAGVDSALMEPPAPDQLVQEIRARHAAGADLSFTKIKTSDPLLVRIRQAALRLIPGSH